MQEIEIKAGSCVYRIQLGALPLIAGEAICSDTGGECLDYKVTFIRQLLEFVLNSPPVGPLLGAGKRLIETLKGRVENVRKLFSNEPGGGITFLNVLNAIRDVKGLANEVLYYIEAFENPAMMPTLYIEPSVFPLGFYLAVLRPLPKSVSNVALNAKLLDDVLYKFMDPNTRMYLKQRSKIEDEQDGIVKNQLNKYRKKLKEQIKEKIKQQKEKITSIFKRKQEMEQEVLSVDEMMITGELSPLSIYEYVIFRWKNHTPYSIRKHKPQNPIGISKSLMDSLNRFTVDDIVIDLINDSSELDKNSLYDLSESKTKTYFIRSPITETFDPRYIISDGEQNIDDRVQRIKFLGISKVVDYVRLRVFIANVGRQLYRMDTIKDRDSDLFYKYYGMMYVPLLPYRNLKGSALYDAENNSVNPAVVRNDYGTFRFLLDELLDKRMRKQNEEKVRKQLYRLINENVPDKKFAIVEPSEPPPDIKPEDVASQSPMVQNIDIDALRYKIGKHSILTVQPSEYDIEPSYSDNNLTERVAYHALHRAKFINEAIPYIDMPAEQKPLVALYNNGELKSEKIKIDNISYADMLTKLFLSDSRNLLEQIAFMKVYYDNTKEELVEASLRYEYARIAPDDKNVKDEDKDINYSIVSNGKQKTFGTGYFAREKIRRMPVVEDLIPDALYALLTYYQLQAALSGADISNSLHYAVSLEPFSHLVPDLPVLVRLDHDDVQAALYGLVAGPERLAKTLSYLNTIKDTKYEFHKKYSIDSIPWDKYSIYKDYLPIKSINITYDNIENASLELFGFTFNIPASWNSLRPQVSIEVYDFHGRPFARYWQAYRKLVFRNNGSWPIMHMSFILDVVAIDNTLTVTDLISLLVVPKSIDMEDINYDSTEPLPVAPAVKIEFEVIGFIDYVDLIANDYPKGQYNAIEHINFNRIADPYNEFSLWYHGQNFNPAPVKFGNDIAIYDADPTKYIQKAKEGALQVKIPNQDQTVRLGLEGVRSRTARPAHLVDNPNARPDKVYDSRIKIFNPLVGGRVSDLAYISAEDVPAPPKQRQ